MVVGCMATACIEEDMAEDFMDHLGCTEVECTTAVLEAQWVVMEWAWVVLMVTQIQIIHMALLLPHQAFGCPSSEW